ncbi:MAG TPA: PAS domain-containing protein [Rhizomicrobium sp.]|jgi:PAS domain-containing protein|nr:PAS domain-containing protein [Rhizomicrobium sp.]
MTISSEDSSSQAGAHESGHAQFLEFAAAFLKTPGLYLILDPSFTIVAANDAYCAATLTVREDIVGRHLFEVFPDNPGDSAADGVQNLRASLLKVLKSRRPDRMAVQKYDIERRGMGAFERRYWSPYNVPLLGPDGYVHWILHCVEDVTEMMALRAEFAAKREESAALRELVRNLARN